VDGILIIDKPAGITSHDVVARVRRILRTKRVGHTGTLDPFATGVMVVLIGKATRLAQFLDKDTKEYVAEVQFGSETDTGDLQGLRIWDCGFKFVRTMNNPLNADFENGKFRNQKSAIRN
jgi:tRNA pseudouridine55 synthase